MNFMRSSLLFFTLLMQVLATLPTTSSLPISITSRPPQALKITLRATSFKSNFHVAIEAPSSNSLLRLRGGGSSSSSPTLSRLSLQSFLSKNYFLIGMILTLLTSFKFPFLFNDTSILRPSFFIGKVDI